MSRPETPTNVTGSVAGKLMSMDWRTGVAISETTGPTTRPTTVSSMPCLMISARTLVECAPRAMRMPISRVRMLTAYEITP